MTDEEVQALVPGIYRVFFVSGKTTLGAVGVDSRGKKWLAHISGMGSCTDFGLFVKELKPLVLDRHQASSLVVQDKPGGSWRGPSLTDETRSRLLDDLRPIIDTGNHLHSLNLRTCDQEMVIKDLASLIVRLANVIRETIDSSLQE